MPISSPKLMSSSADEAGAADPLAFDPLDQASKDIMIRSLEPFLVGVTLTPRGQVPAWACTGDTSESAKVPSRQKADGSPVWRPRLHECCTLRMHEGHVTDWHTRAGGSGLTSPMAGGAAGCYDIGSVAWDGFGSWAGSRFELSNEQLARTKPIIGVVHRQRWELRGKLIEGQNKLTALLEEQASDPKAVGATYAALSGLHQQMLQTQLQARSEIYALLTPEQRKEAEQQRRLARKLERAGRGYRCGITPR
jgi:Spy/CpxP family protein refolding chaperone